MKTLSLIASIALLIGVSAAYSGSQDVSNSTSEFQQGYSAGYAQGKADGYIAGFKDAHDEFKDSNPNRFQRVDDTSFYFDTATHRQCWAGAPIAKDTLQWAIKHDPKDAAGVAFLSTFPLCSDLR